MNAPFIPGTHAEAVLVNEFLENIAHATLRDIMAELDQTALRNIRNRGKDGKLNPIGGPFSAELYVYLRRSKKLVRVGGKATNSVVTTGDASNHAEGNNLRDGQTLYELRDLLYNAKREGEEPVLVQFSSAESCPSCRAKQMQLQFELAAEGMVHPGGMIVVFGAPYADTLNLAGFNDLPYSIALMAHHIDPKAEGQMVTVETQNWDDVPEDVRHQFVAYACKGSFFEPRPGFSVIYRKDAQGFPDLVVTGTDRRATTPMAGDDPSATAEVEAIRAKCAADKEAGIKEPWKSPGTLYTLTPHVGPSAVAHAQWGSIGKIISIANAPPDIARILPTQEIRGMANSEFLRLATLGYNKPGTGMGVIRVATPNLAQREWLAVVQELGGEVHYNALGGLDEYPALKKFQAEYDHRFTAPFLGA